MAKKKEHIVYLLPVDEAREHIERKYVNDEEKCEDFALYVDEEMTEEECKEIVEDSEDELADSYTLREFQAEFNFGLEDGEITSIRYFIKIF